EKAAAQKILSQVKGLIQSKYTAVVYSLPGRFVSAHSQVDLPNQPAPLTGWFGPHPALTGMSPTYVSYSLSPGSDKVLGLVLPLGKKQPNGFLMVSWSDQFVQWLKGLSTEETGIYIIDSAGRIIASSTD